MKTLGILLVAALAQGCIRHSDPPPSRGALTRVRLEQFKVALQTYRLEYGHFPTGDEATVTAALTTETARTDNSRGIRFLWIERDRKCPEIGSTGAYLDGWGNPVRLEWAYGRNDVVIRSLGKDGLVNTEDDIAVPMPIAEKERPEPEAGGYRR